MRSTHQRLARSNQATLSAASRRSVCSSAASRAEQESDSDRQRERRVGPLLERLVDGVDHVVADLAHRVDRFLTFGAGVRNHALDSSTWRGPTPRCPWRRRCRAICGVSCVTSLRNASRSAWMSPLAAEAALAALRAASLASLDGIANLSRIAVGRTGHWTYSDCALELFAVPLTGRKRKSSIGECRQPGSLTSSSGKR